MYIQQRLHVKKQMPVMHHFCKVNNVFSGLQDPDLFGQMGEGPWFPATDINDNEKEVKNA
ncbi:MAG: hypothetical protein U5K27_05040 [Desulfotignum sp.]|nr:hypothetical protein [Desulfotignum sp.]